MALARMIGPFTQLPVLGYVAHKSFGLGMVAVAVAAKFGRPLLVGAVRAGYEVTGAASDLLHQAKAEAAEIRAEARSARTTGTAAEIQQLREEIAALRAPTPKRGSAAS